MKTARFAAAAMQRHRWLLLLVVMYVGAVTVLGGLASFNPRSPAPILIAGALLSVWGWIAQQAVLYGTLIVLALFGANLSSTPAAGPVLLAVSALAYPVAALVNVWLIALVGKLVRPRPAPPAQAAT